MINKHKVNLFKGLSEVLSSLFKSAPEPDEREGNESADKSMNTEDSFSPDTEKTKEGNECLTQCIKGCSDKAPKIPVHRKRPAEKLSVPGQITSDLTKKVFQHDFFTNPARLNEFYKYLYKRFLRLQITLSNPSDVSKEISLFGAYKGDPVTIDSGKEIEYVTTKSIFTGIGSSPQGITYNPVNKLIYTACQLDNSVAVFSVSEGATMKISLGGTFPGSISPLFIAIHPVTGDAYVTGAVSDSVHVIDKNLFLKESIYVGKRPTGIAFNPVTGLFYVALLAENSVALLDPLSKEVRRKIMVGSSPIGVAVHSGNGKVYVANAEEDSVSIIIPSERLPVTALNIYEAKYPVYHPPSGNIYIASKHNDQVYEIDGENQQVRNIGMVRGSHPSNILYNAFNQYLYVANSNAKSFTVMTPDEIIGTVPMETSVTAGLAFDPVSNSILISDPEEASVKVMSFKPTAVTVSDNYYEVLQDLKLNPLLLKHVKWVHCGAQRIYTMELIYSRPTSKLESHSLSLSNYYSPQGFQNVLELYSFQGQVIDGNTIWKFKLPPRQTLTILLYYRQIKREMLLNQNMK